MEDPNANAMLSLEKRWQEDKDQGIQVIFWDKLQKLLKGGKKINLMFKRYK